MSGTSAGLARTGLAALLCAALLSSCALVGPPYASTHPNFDSGARGGVLPHSSGAPQIDPLANSGRSSSLPGSADSFGGAPQAMPQYALGPAAQSLVADAHQQEHRRDYGLAAETLERALSIEPRNPRVWLEFAKETLAAGHAAQANGMARKALYLAAGNPSVQASAWGVIAATLRAEGQTQAAVAAEQKAAELSVQ
jgi:tetratricopeptide (TPR) repeat protein